MKLAPLKGDYFRTEAYATMKAAILAITPAGGGPAAPSGTEIEAQRAVNAVYELMAILDRSSFAFRFWKVSG